MATSTARRVELPPDPPSRSAERERLAQAHAVFASVSARFDRIQSAKGGAEAAAFEKFVEIEALEEEIAEAARVSRESHIAALLGDPAPTGQTLQAIEGRLEAARAEQKRCKQAATALEAELGGVSGMRTRYENAKAELDSAVNAVIAVEAGEAVAAAYSAAKLRAGSLRDLGIFLKMKDWRLGNIEIPGIIPPEASLVSPWKDALERLRAGDVDAVLPSVD